MSPALPILYTLFLWWFSTGVILFLVGMPRATYRTSFLLATVLGALALFGIAHTSLQTDVTAMYCAFSCALLVWGWIETAFLIGYCVGPRTLPCPRDSRGFGRAVLAIQTILYHELALLTVIGIAAALTWHAPNRLALWTLVVLWIGRQSAKLNLFLGVRNFSEHFLPDELRYLSSYFKRRAMNALFPFSVAVGCFVAYKLWLIAINSIDAPQAVAAGFLATLSTLAVLEHFFLVVPLRVDALWDWSTRSRRAHDRKRDNPVLKADLLSTKTRPAETTT